MNFLNVEINFINFLNYPFQNIIILFQNFSILVHMDDRFPTTKFFTRLSLEFWKPAKA